MIQNLSWESEEVKDKFEVQARSDSLVGHLRRTPGHLVLVTKKTSDNTETGDG